MRSRRNRQGRSLRSRQRILSLLAASSATLLVSALFSSAGSATTLTSLKNAGAGPHVTSASTPTPSTACTNLLTSFASTSNPAAPSNDQTIAVQSSAELDNPTTANTSTTPQHLTLSFTIYNGTGKTIVPSVAQPMTIAIYDAPAGSVTTTPPASGSSPLTLSVTTGSTVSLSYDGSYLSRPLTVMAITTLYTVNPCTLTHKKAIGSTTLSLEHVPTTLGTASFSAPTRCRSGTTGSACAAKNVDTGGLSLLASVGYGASVPTSSAPIQNATSAEQVPDTVDTGSIGTVVPFAKLGPDAVGPGPTEMKYYDSSGNEFIGFTYLAPVTLSMGSSQAETIPIRVLAVVTSGCHAGKSCKHPPPFANFFYLGVGFDRSGTVVNAPFASPRDNAFLSVEPSSGLTLSQGYLLSGASITVGVTASNTTGFTTEPLSTSSTTPGDWLGAPACIAFPNTAHPSPSGVCGHMLLDVGIPQMYITFTAPADVPAVVRHGLAVNQMITFASPSANAPVLGYTFSSGPLPHGAAPPTTGMNPSSVGLSSGSGSSGGTDRVFINTGRHILFDNDYLYDAQLGQTGFFALAVPLR